MRAFDLRPMPSPFLRHRRLPSLPHRPAFLPCRCAFERRAWAPLAGDARALPWRGFRAVEVLRNGEKGASFGGDLGEEKREESKAGAASMQRRQRGGSVANVDLLTIPGVGPRNLRKLVDKGFTGVAQLKQLYRDKIYLA